MGRITAKNTPNTRPVWLWIGVIAVAAIVIVALALSRGKPEAAFPLEINVDEAAELYQAGAFLLDVRQPEEWKQGHIPGATLIPLGELQGRVSEVPEDQQVVVICRSDNRSAQGRDILLKAGYPEVTSVAGGMNRWTAAGHPTVTGP